MFPTLVIGSLAAQRLIKLRSAGRTAVVGTNGHGDAPASLRFPETAAGLVISRMGSATIKYAIQS
jgi:hypothetical protein